MRLTEQQLEFRYYVAWCRKYHYKPGTAVALKAYYRLVKGERP